MFIILKMRIAMKLKVKGMIAMLKEKLMFLFHFLDAARISIKHKSIKSPTITELQYWGRPVVVAIDPAPKEVISEGVTLGEITFVNIKTPVSNNNLYFNIM
jgi:hypothetical protein